MPLKTNKRNHGSIFCVFMILVLVSALSVIPALECIIPDATDEQDGNRDMIILRDLFSKYDWRIRPKGTNATRRGGGPVIVSTNLYLRTISKIDDVNMEYSTQFTFREKWNDARLAFGRMTIWKDGDMPPFLLLVPDDAAQRVWMPDTFFQNEKNAHRHMVDKPNVLIRIYPDGDVLYSVRLSLTLSCPMKLYVYPMDRQVCLIDLASYAYTTDDIIYEWTNDTPIQLKDTVKISLPSFDLIGHETGSCTSKTATGEYSCLRVSLHFQRMFSYYLLQLYIPSFMLVIVSWVSFWVDKSSVPARVTLGVTTLLTITTQASGINAKLPPVSYTKAVDVWIGVCLAFVFGALLEYALVNYAGNDIDQHRKKTKAKEIKHCVTETVPFVHHQVSGRDSPVHALCNANDENRHGWAKPREIPAELSCHKWCTHEKCDHYGTLIPLCPDTSALLMARKRNRTAFSNFQRWLIALYREADRPKKIDMLSRVLFPIGFLIFNVIYWYIYYWYY